MHTRHTGNMQIQTNNLSQRWIFVAPNELTLEYSVKGTPEVEGEGGLAGALDQKKALSVILHIKLTLNSVWFCTSCLMCQ